MKQVIDRINDCKIIAVLSGISADRIIPAVKALTDGGIDCVVIEFDPKGIIDPKSICDCILMVSRYFGDKVCVGAGNVTSASEAELSAVCGADFILCNHTDSFIIETAKEHSLTVISGAFTPTEIISAKNCGADIVNIYPASFFGTEYLEEITASLPDINLCVSGGVNVWNMRAFLDCGCFAAIVGGSLVSEALKASPDYEIITQTAIAYKGITENIRKR
ncbi:MAG: bifunctional 4-hydroxy-2-oxoglutarate aldolase/2-dehydro-3-deoxy-phosphogluconate aldolase [Clostridia bacterium]|nr:bifunctional 4-hydroxy-2-oxoglutarate aldolase/2-dehydro-3-deoxy-phosphogluconate aldolase [Clostridia bacterium]